MYDDRRSREFHDGLLYFLGVANANKPANGFVCCPCANCQNKRDYSSTSTLHSHLIRSGFMRNYTCWTKHGETGVLMEECEDEDEDNIPGIAEYNVFGDTFMGEGEDEVGEEVAEDVGEDGPTDDLGQMLRDE